MYRIAFAFFMAIQSLTQATAAVQQDEIKDALAHARLSITGPDSTSRLLCWLAWMMLSKRSLVACRRRSAQIAPGTGVHWPE
jgi:hypothetical protein